MKTLVLKKPSKIIFALLAFMLIFNYQGSYGQTNEVESIEENDSLAQENESWNRFSVSFGGFFAGYNSNIKVGSQQLGLGLVIDIEAALGLKVTSFNYRGKAIYRFGKTKRHALAVGYFGINRNASKILEDTLQVGDIIFDIGTELNSRFDLSIIRVIYDYSLYQDKRVSIGASIGLFIMPVKFKVKAKNSEEQVTNFVAPFPLIGLRTDFQISKKFYLLQTAELLYLSFTDFRGGLLDLSIILEHKTFKNVAFGIGINSNRVDVTIKNPDSNINFFGDIRMDYTGLVLYGRYFF
jgi:hypothetical protein